MNDWRRGQFLFNFLEWLHTAKGYDTNQGSRMADPFHIPDATYEKLLEEFRKINGVWMEPTLSEQGQ